MTRRGAIPAVLGIVAVLGGCATTPVNTGFQKLATTPPGPPITPDEIYPQTFGSWTYAVTAGDGAGTKVVMRRAGTEEYDAAWADHDGSRRVEYWRVDVSGNLVMPAVVDHHHRTISFFDPPLIVAHRQLPPGKPLRQQVAMRVMDLRRPDQLKEHGTVVNSIEYADDCVVKTPLGRHSTKRLVVRFEADLQLASALTTATFYIVPGIGSVVEERHEIERVMGIAIRNWRQTRVLRSAPETLLRTQQASSSIDSEG